MNSNDIPGMDLSPIIEDGELVGVAWTPDRRTRIMGWIVTWNPLARWLNGLAHERLRLYDDRRWWNLANRIHRGATQGNWSRTRPTCSHEHPHTYGI